MAAALSLAAHRNGMDANDTIRRRPPCMLFGREPFLRGNLLLLFDGKSKPCVISISSTSQRCGGINDEVARRRRNHRQLDDGRRSDDEGRHADVDHHQSVVVKSSSTLFAGERLNQIDQSVNHAESSSHSEEYNHGPLSENVPRHPVGGIAPLAGGHHQLANGHLRYPGPCRGRRRRC